MSEINLKDIHSPADIKTMSLAELRTLAAELRGALIKKLAAHGGHVGPNLGMVEAIIALHYVFDAPTDKIVFDVSHQSYVHKMLTGRIEAFIDPEHYNDVTGYTNPHESPDYDLFSIGHTSTSLSLASGLAKARDLQGGTENVIAVIGDGSLGGGQALEGLNYGATLGTNFIVVVNDNDMSIAENHGGLYADLRMLRHTNGEGQPNIFRSFGYSYRYVHYGNDLRSLIEIFESVKNIDHPVVIHLNTMKGCGLPVAEAYKEKFHYNGPFDPKTGASAGAGDAPANGLPASYNDFFATHMLGMIADNPKVAVINAGTPGAIGFTPSRRRQAGKHFIDVGIAEQDAVGMAAGMAKAAMRPVMGVVSTFLQRAYDQLSHDVAINNLPAVFTIFYPGLYSMNDETHLGFFDIALVSNIPNFNYLAPTCLEEYRAMLDWAAGHAEGPVAVRTPDGEVISDPSRELLDDYSQPRYEFVRRGEKVALIGAGNFFYLAAKAADLLAGHGVNATLINPRTLSALDTAALDSLAACDLVITLEDGIVDGGFGQKVAAYLSPKGTRVECMGLKKEFINEFNAGEIAEALGLTPQQIADKVLAAL